MPELADPELAEFDYNLPRAAIAQTPADPRDQARLLVDQGPDGTSTATSLPPLHRRVCDLPELLQPGDLLVANNTKVIPARLLLHKRSGGAAEVLLLEPLGTEKQGTVKQGKAPGWWSALVKPGRRLSAGTELSSRLDTNLRVTVGERITDPVTGIDDGQRAVFVMHGNQHSDQHGDQHSDQPVATPDDAARLLGVAGQAPLPPYINNPTNNPTNGPAGNPTNGPASNSTSNPTQDTMERYQTVYADQPGSVAAPTAGLHFTPALLDALASKGIGWATVDLVVGLGTFRPISGKLSDHVMHTERYRVPETTWQQCQNAKRVVAVGTTTVRALESAARGSLAGRTDLFLQRGDRFQVVDALLTNFHLPRSTLLMLIDAFVGSRWRSLYETALANDYRFLSFGDAMLLQHKTDQHKTDQHKTDQPSAS